MNVYEKLGDLLNDALEQGEIPHEKVNKDQVFFDDNEIPNQVRNDRLDNRDILNLVRDDSFSDNEIPKQNQNDKKATIRAKKKQIPTGEVIKMHKYTQNMHISPEIQKALTTLDIAYPTTWKKIQSQYRKLLKIYHPDTKNTIQSSQNVQNNRQLTILDIQNAYKILDSCFNKQGI